MIVSLTGFTACGKSSAGKLLAEKLGWEFIDLDSYIEHKAGRSVPEIFNEDEEYFRAMEIEAVTDVVSMHRLTGENVVLSLGGGTFTLEPARKQLLEHSRCIYIKASPETIRERLGGDLSGRPVLNGKNISEMLAHREVFYNECPDSIESDKLSAEEVADALLTLVYKWTN